MKTKKQFLALLAVTLVLGMLTGCCSKYDSPNTAYETAAEYYDSAAGAVYNAELSAAPNAAMTRGTDSGISLPANRKWIITMNLSAETEDLDATLGALGQQISTMGGYVEAQNITNSASYRRTRSASLTVRIPADQADAFVTEIDGIANIISNSRNVQDVTLEYADTEGRITALKTEEARLLELMRQAENMSDLLEIEARLTEVCYQLENYASSLRLYDNQIDYATVTLYISEVEKFTPVEEPGFWKRVSEGLADSLVSLGEAIVDLIAWVIVELPYIIVWGLVCFVLVMLGKRFYRKRRAKKEAKKQAEG